MKKEEFESIVTKFVGGLVTERCCGDQNVISIFSSSSFDGKYPKADSVNDKSETMEKTKYDEKYLIKSKKKKEEVQYEQTHLF